MPAHPDASAASSQDRRFDPSLRHLVAILVVIFVVAALKATKPVTMPLAFALFFVMLFWPLYRRLSERAPRWIALATTLLALLAVFGAFVGAIWFAVDEVIESGSEYRQAFETLRTRAESLAGLGGAESGEDGGSGSGLSAEQLLPVVQRGVAQVWSVLGYLVLIFALFTLALHEVRRWEQKLRTRFDDPVSGDLIDTARRVAKQVQRFLLVQSFTAVVTGVLAGLICWALGVDFALLWGLLSLLLNFIPTLGSIVAVALPTAFALVQYGIAWQVFVLVAALAAVEVTLGAYVDPLLQGRYLRISALVVLVAITFWGWVWGVAGAFIATPITAALVLAFEQSDRTEWVARLLTRADDEGPAAEHVHLDAT